MTNTDRVRVWIPGLDPITALVLSRHGEDVRVVIDDPAEDVVDVLRTRIVCTTACNVVLAQVPLVDRPSISRVCATVPTSSRPTI